MSYSRLLIYNGSYTHLSNEMRWALDWSESGKKLKKIRAQGAVRNAFGMAFKAFKTEQITRLY